MLFHVDGSFIELVRESCYEGVVTVCGPSRKSLSPFTGLSLAEPVRLHGQSHKWAIHVAECQIPSSFRSTGQQSFEQVDRLTGPALAYVYDYILESSLEGAGPYSGEYGFCWPEDMQKTKASLYNREDPAADGVSFLPIWTLPVELTGAPRRDRFLDAGDDNGL
jgi:hypothetical protein